MNAPATNDDIAAAEARGRQQMIDALRDAKRFTAWRWPNPPPWQRKSEPREPNLLAAAYLEAIANQATPDTPTPRGYDYDTEGLGGT